MMPVGRRMPGYVQYPHSRRVLYGFRGVVERCEVVKSGWWLFKKESPRLSIRICNELRRRILNRRLVTEGERFSVEESRGGTIPSLRRYLCTSEDLRKFPVGTTVGITFSFATTKGLHPSEIEYLDPSSTRLWTHALRTLSTEDSFDEEFVPTDAEMLIDCMPEPFSLTLYIRWGLD